MATHPQDSSRILISNLDCHKFLARVLIMPKGSSPRSLKCLTVWLLRHEEVIKSRARPLPLILRSLSLMPPRLHENGCLCLPRFIWRKRKVVCVSHATSAAGKMLSMSSTSPLCLTSHFLCRRKVVSVSNSTSGATERLSVSRTPPLVQEKSCLCLIFHICCKEKALCFSHYISGTGKWLLASPTPFLVQVKCCFLSPTPFLVQMTA